MCAHLCVYFGEGCLFLVPHSGFSDAVLVCKHGTFSSVVLSNITNAGKCDCGDLHPSISFGKEEHTRRTRQMEDKLDHNHT